jgi:transposase InsO family protein
MDKGCRMAFPPRKPQQNNNSQRQEPQKRTWIRKHNQYSNEECTIALQDNQNKCGWYVDNGYSKHMTSDKDRFITLRKERDGPDSFRNDDSTKIIGKGTVKIGNKELVENEMDSKIKCLRSDNGGDFTSNEFMDYCTKHGIKRQLSVTRTP